MGEGREVPFFTRSIYMQWRRQPFGLGGAMAGDLADDIAQACKQTTFSTRNLSLPHQKY
jgi:hypothetical protein